MSKGRLDHSISVNIPPLPKTKDQLKEKNRKLRKELDDLRRIYKDNVYKVIENLKRHYNETKHDLTPSYDKLKHLIKYATSEEVLEQCRVPDHKHSVQNKGIDHSFNHNSSACVELHVKDAVASRYDHRKGAAGFLQSCREFAGHGESQAVQQRRREVTDMHKAEIAIENEELKHHIQCYDSKFLRAHNRLSKLKQEYAESKQYLPPKRYRLLKEMIETVVEDSKLKPD
ncbi:uncharacterized protein LOC125667933 isoform X2 [Ostrea edulis]|uniref:uncharacterized protein LOC125667933 isoform X2 n=1 Tax=Ostrea edulis TaxID=37623 RepID=UPI0020956639|nr:uncharacterized protein LOC125667933 isoform X2 [Ostrea edulis]XP_056019730.1 uncharacterized protein LOC125667933 isoform X2 [Ostrea edulis]